MLETAPKLPQIFPPKRGFRIWKLLFPSVFTPKRLQDPLFFPPPHIFPSERLQDPLPHPKRDSGIGDPLFPPQFFFFSQNRRFRGWGAPFFPLKKKKKKSHPGVLKSPFFPPKKRGPSLIPHLPPPGGAVFPPLSLRPRARAVRPDRTTLRGTRGGGGVWGGGGRNDDTGRVHCEPNPGRCPGGPGAAGDAAARFGGGSPGGRGRRTPPSPRPRRRRPNPPGPGAGALQGRHLLLPPARHRRGRREALGAPDPHHHAVLGALAGRQPHPEKRPVPAAGAARAHRPPHPGLPQPALHHRLQPHHPARARAVHPRLPETERLPPDPGTRRRGSVLRAAAAAARGPQGRGDAAGGGAAGVPPAHPGRAAAAAVPGQDADVAPGHADAGGASPGTARGQAGFRWHHLHPPVAQEAHREVGGLRQAPVRAPVRQRPPRAHQRPRGRAVPLHPPAPGLRPARAAQERHEGDDGVAPGHALQRPRHRGDHRQQRHRPRHPDLGPRGGDPARAAGQSDRVPLQHGRGQRAGPAPGGALPHPHGRQRPGRAHARVRFRAADVARLRRVPGGVAGAAVAAGRRHRRLPEAAAHRRQGRELPHLGGVRGGPRGPP